MAKKEKEKKKGRLPRPVIVIIVILVICIIGAAMGGSDDEEDEITTEAMTETLTEERVAVEVETEAAVEVETEKVTEAVETEKPDGPLNHITSYNYTGTEEDPEGSGKTYMFWSVNFDEDANTDQYDNNDFKEIIIACMQQPESQENEADDFSIEGFDSEGQLVFDWTSYIDKYTITQYIWRSGQTNPDRYEWGLSGSDYDEIMKARTETEPGSESNDDEAPEEETSGGSGDWDAGSLAYLGMSRDTLMQIYDEYDQLLKSEDTSTYDSEEMEAFETGCAQQIADEYGISTDDVDNIYIYGGSPNYFATFDTDAVKLRYADSVEVQTAGDTVMIKAKISPGLTNSQTIDRNYYNVCNFIRDYSGTDFDSISYWATADTTDGDETKVISFDLSGDIITKIATEDFADNTLGDYVENLYILPSLQE